MRRKGFLRDKSAGFCENRGEVSAMANVGKQIKKLRMARSMTQDDLAERLFVSRQTVSNYETGKSNPDIDMLLHIAQVFETDVNCLIYGPPVPSDRKREKRRAMILTAVTAALAVAMAVLLPWAKEYLRETFIALPSYWLYYIGWPLLMFLTGWTVLELAGSFLGAKGPKWRRSKWVRWGLIGLLLIYGAMAVPFRRTAQTSTRQPETLFISLSATLHSLLAASTRSSTISVRPLAKVSRFRSGPFGAVCRYSAPGASAAASTSRPVFAAFGAGPTPTPDCSGPALP